MLAKPKQAKKVLKAACEIEVSDKIREHLTAKATAMVHDWSPPLRNAVTEDPRIQKRFIRSKRQIEKAVLQDYKRELSQKRKDKLNLRGQRLSWRFLGFRPKRMLPYGQS